MSKPRAEVLIHNIGQLLTLEGPAPMRAADSLSVVADGAVAMGGGRILTAGGRHQVCEAVSSDENTQYYDAGGGLVTPGLIDPHTHLLYAGSRHHELALRLEGHSYLDILNQGGGILNTVRATRAASDEELLSSTRSRLNRLLAHGVTSLEIKSGYGLEPEEELRQLRLINQLARERDQNIIPTFMGAHAVPSEFQQRTDDYVRLVVDEMLPRAAPLARFCDVFCEAGVFTIEQSRLILQRARELGLGLKIHADELSAYGGAELAAEVGAITAEHLLCTGAEGREALAAAGVIAVLLPGTSFYLQKPYAAARTLMERGVPVAVATDSNPGSSPTENPQLILTLACLYLGMTPAQAWAAATINAACALGIAEESGSLAAGKRGDVVVFHAPDHTYVPYHYGNNLAKAVFCGGRLVCDNSTGEE